MQSHSDWPLSKKKDENLSKIGPFILTGLEWRTSSVVILCHQDNDSSHSWGSDKDGECVTMSH